MGLSPRTLRPANTFTPRSITGLALWLDASDSQSLFTTDAGAVTAVSSPTEIAGCALWLDGADSSSTGMTLNGSLVETWKDKSNSGNNVTASGGLRPTLTSNALNGRSVLTFGGSQGLTGNLAASITTNAYSVFVVCKISGAITNGRLLSTAGAGNDFASGSVIPCVSNGGTLSAYAGTQSTTPSSVTGFASYGVFAGVLSSNLVTNSAGGMSVASAAATLSTAVTRLGVGVAAQGGTGFNTCDIAEIILYPTALSNADRARVEAYLAAKWGISGVHTQATATSDPVGAWLDKSGNARHATQSTAGSRPKVSTAGMNGGRSVQFFGGNTELLSFGNLSSVFPSAGEIIVAYEPLTDSSYGLYETTTSSSFFRNGNGLSYFGALSQSRQAGISVSMPTSGRHVASMRCSSGGQQVVRLDGAQVFAGSPVVGYLAGASHVIGNTNNANTDTGLTGYITDVLAFPRILTDAERTRIEKWLAARRGITLAPQVSNADAQDWINRVYANGGSVSSSTAAAVNQFCNDIDYGVGGVSIRDRFYRLNLFAGGTSGTAVGLNSALVPLYRGQSLGGTQYGGTIDTNNGPFLPENYNDTGASGGLVGNGSSKWLNTGFLGGAAGLTTNSVHLSAVWPTFTQAGNSNTFPVSMITPSAGERHWINVNSDSTPTTNVNAFLGQSGGNSAVNSISSTNGGVSIPGGLWVASRVGLSDLRLYLGSTERASQTATIGSASLSSEALSVFGRWNGTATSLFFGQRMMGYSVGLGMSSAQVSAYNAAMTAFNTAMSRNV